MSVTYLRRNGGGDGRGWVKSSSPLYKLLDQGLPVNPIASLSIKAPVTENPTAKGHLHQEIIDLVRNLMEKKSQEH